MTLLDDIALAISGLTGNNSLYQFHVLKSGQMVFSSDMSDKTLTAMCIIADPLISLNSIPDRYGLVAEYWVLHRYWSTKDANQSTYYHQLYKEEWAKAKHNRLKPLDSSLGSDL